MGRPSKHPSNNAGRALRIRLARLDALSEAERAALNAKLPPEFQWGKDALEAFEYGKQCAARAIRSISPHKV